MAQQDEGGAIQLLLDKMQRNGQPAVHLGSLRRALGGNSGFDAQHTNVLSELVLKDMALTLSCCAASTTRCASRATRARPSSTSSVRCR